MDDMDERSDGSRQTGSANPAKIHYLFRDLHRNRKSKGKSKSREERPLRDAERNSEELFVFMFSNERRLLCIGAVRFRAEDEATYLPKELLEGIGLERLRKADGVQAPVLFRLPLLRRSDSTFFSLEITHACSELASNLNCATAALCSGSAVRRPPPRPPWPRSSSAESTSEFCRVSAFVPRDSSSIDWTTLCAQSAPQICSNWLPCVLLCVHRALRTMCRGHGGSGSLHQGT